MLTYYMISQELDGIRQIDFETILIIILQLPFTLMIDIAKDIVIFTILWNIIKFSIKFI